MSDAATIENVEGVAGEPGPRRLAPGLKRNLVVIGVALAVVLSLIVASAILVARSGTSDRVKTNIAPAQSPAAQGIGQSAAAQMTPAEAERLNRVQSAEAHAAATKGETYIPKEMPSAIQTPRTPVPGAGPAPYSAYPAQATAYATTAVADTKREERIEKGLEVQLNELLKVANPPTSQRADAYVASSGATGQRAAAGATAPTQTASASAASTPTGKQLVGVNEVAMVELTSPIDTERSDYVSARVTSGKLAGAFLTGSAKIFNEEGVRTVMTRMQFGGKSYTVNALLLDNETASDALNASIDHHTLARYVMPVVFATAQAFAAARAQTGSTAVATGVGTTGVTTPAPTTQQAQAAGVAAAMQIAGQAVARAAAKPNTAYLPARSVAGLIFMDPVLEK